MAWNYRRYGTLSDPVHKSQLVQLTSDFGCPRRFKFERDDESEREASDVAYGRSAVGSAVHETIARALSTPAFAARVVQGPGTVSRERVEVVFFEELEAEVRGRPVEWSKKQKQDTAMREAVDMVFGLFETLHEHVHAIELVEAGFIFELDGMWCSGFTDLVYRPKSDPNAIALSDWKTGQRKPGQIDLDHGWEAGIYAQAIHAGTFLPRESLHTEAHGDQWLARVHHHEAIRPTRYRAQRDAVESALRTLAAADSGDESAMRAVDECDFDVRRFDAFPAAIHHVHLRDLIPYQKAGDKTPERPEDLAFYKLDSPRKIKYRAGERRGPAWLPVRRSEADIPRLSYRMKTLVGTVRMGRFLDLVSETRCSRCPYSLPCLKDGYGPRGDELADIEAKLRAIGE